MTPDRVTDFQIDQLSMQLNKLGNSVDKICNRIEKLEDDYHDRTLKKKIISILFCIYPLIMVFFMITYNSDHQKISEIFNQSKQLMDVIDSINMK